MGKLRKLVRHPVLFFVDAVKKRTGGTAVSVSQGPRKTKAEKQPDAEVLKAREATQTNVTKVERLKTQEDKAEKSSTEGKKDVMASEVAASKGRNLAAEGGNAAKKPRVQPEGAQNVPAKSADDDDGLPVWYNGQTTPELLSALATNKPVFLYVPWIAEHGDALIKRLASDEYVLAPLEFVKDLDAPNRRRSVLRFARDCPEVYRRLIIRRLVPLRSKVKAMILTFDWAPVMRIIAMACQDMGIPCILIPHESVFVDRTKYYWDPKSHGSVPVADVVLGWGGLQREIFVERGYPAERFIAVGAPKFDAYHSMEPLLTREAFARLFGLDPQKKIALFATQPLDSQLDTKTARAAQRAAILDLAKALLDMDGQLIVRLPPSKDNILGSIVEKKLAELGNVAVDDAQCYLVPPEEAIYHSDLVTSINSTMLFEALLAGRPSLSLKYTEFDQIWRHAGIPAVTSAEELRPAVEQLLSGEWKPSEEGMRWAASQFSCGEFDGKAAERIRNFLRDVATGTRVIDSRGSAFERLLRRDIVDVAAIPNAENLSSHLKAMLGTRTLISSNLEPLEMPHVATVDIFIQWGITPTKNKQRQAELAKRLGRPTVIVEDGFLRSLDIGLSGEPALSIILDTKTAYYDATRVSWLAEQLEHGREITEAERRRARAAIEAIVSNRLSKYNHAPDIPLQIGDRRRKVLVLDQRFGDESVRSGLADESTFDRMLYDAIKHRADCDIIVKLHPDAIKGGKGSYLAPDRYPFLKFVNNVYFVDFDVNPHSLFDIVDEVFVVTSGMGFEALMAGKTVHCYGMPYYAGWGVTDDRQTLPTRTRKRSVEEIFHFAYIEASRYYSPKLGRACEIEDLIAYLAENTGFRKNDGDRMAA